MNLKTCIAYGISNDLVLEQDTVFTSAFWQELQNIFGTSLHMHTALYPDSDGQADMTNSMLDHALRHDVANVLQIPCLPAWVMKHCSSALHVNLEISSMRAGDGLMATQER